MFIKNYDAVGKALKNARDAYEDGEKKLLEKGQSIVVTCNQLEALGAKQNANYPVPQLNAIDASCE
jgi:DNA recombination protein RmuC